MALRTIEDLGDLRGRRVLVRVDFNVPLDGSEITDDTRIRAALPTIRELLAAGARLVLLSHLGRPKGKRDERFSLRPVAVRLAQLLGTVVPLVDAVVGPVAEEAVAGLRDGQAILLENVRFEAGEETNDAGLARGLAALADAYVSDAFGAAHRAHASTEGVAHLLPAAAGRLLVREVETLTGILEAPERPFVAILGGAKVADKIGVLDRLCELADTILIGGAMAFTFVAAAGGAVGDSMHEGAEGQAQATSAVAKARERGVELLLPTDVLAGDRFAADAATRAFPADAVEGGWMGLDIGPGTAARYAEIVRGAATVLWNGPMGVAEFPAFATGTNAVAEAMAECEGTTVIGGGDSVAAIGKLGLEDRISHVSTGGGASLELLEGKRLPGVEVLERREDG
jgi:phosphoglycerate kinase